MNLTPKRKVRINSDAEELEYDPSIASETPETGDPAVQPPQASQADPSAVAQESPADPSTDGADAVEQPDPPPVAGQDNPNNPIDTPFP